MSAIVNWILLYDFLRLIPLEIGDKVFGEVDLGRGTAAEYLIVTEKAKEIFHIPTESNQCMSLMEAAAIQCSLETAYQALFNYGAMHERSGESILILGGSTVIGMYAIQICKNVFQCSNITGYVVAQYLNSSILSPFDF